MKTKLQVKREEAGLTPKKLALKVLNGHTEHLNMISAAIVLHEARLLDLNEVGVLDRYAIALNCSVKDLAEDGE